MRFPYDGASLRASRLTTLVLSVLVALGALLTVMPNATAASARAATGQTTTTHSRTHQSSAAVFHRKADRVLRVASKQKGDPYRYGAAGPNAFDCSGLVMYVYKHALGRNLPHNAEAQLRDSKRIYHRGNLRPGDLIFAVDGSGYAYHVGIFAGHGFWWVAPHSGTRVHKQRIYHARFRYGRLISS